MNKRLAQGIAQGMLLTTFVVNRQVFEKAGQVQKFMQHCLSNQEFSRSKVTSRRRATENVGVIINDGFVLLYPDLGGDSTMCDKVICAPRCTGLLATPIERDTEE